MDIQKIPGRGSQECSQNPLNCLYRGLHGPISSDPYPTYQSEKIGRKKGIPLKKRPDPNKGNAEYLRALMEALGDSKSDSKKLWELIKK